MHIFYFLLIAHIQDRQPEAMVALMAMLFQNGTVGTTGPAMWLPAA